MPKTIQVSDEAAALVQRIVDQGRYADVETAWADAARLLDEQDYNRELQEKLQEAMEQVERGEVFPWTRELSQQVFEEAMEMVRLGIRPDPDVCP
jgi:hypothetical protein